MTTGKLTTVSLRNTTSTDDSDKSVDLESGIMDGTVIGILINVVTILIAAALGVYCWAKNRRNQSNVSKAPNNSVASNNNSISSKTVPMASILTGQAPLPSNDEFDKLTKYHDGFTDRFTTSQGKRYNKDGNLNLIPEILPFDHNRVKIKSPIDGCDYINATWLTNTSEDSTYDELIFTTYQPYKNINFIVGQDPIPATMQHHFRLIIENKIDLVVSFGDKESPSNFNVGETYAFKDVCLKIRNRTKIAEHLCRTEMTITHTAATGLQTMHNFVYFDFVNFPKNGITSTEDAENLVKSICTIRSELKHQATSLKVFAHDSRGGVQGASTFVVLYGLMQEIDEGMTEDGQIRNEVENLDVFRAVNRLRKDRAHAIEDFCTYQGLLHCLNYYGSKRSVILQKASTKVTGTVGRDLQQEGADENSSTASTTSSDNDEIKYVLDDDTNEQDKDIFSGYYVD